MSLPQCIPVPNNPRFIDMTGQTVGRWTVLGLSRAGRHPQWRCRCACGVERNVGGENIRRGLSQSCGCLREDQPNPNFRHGLTRSSEWIIWYGMRQRCYYKRHSSYHLYGARGITVCERWQHSFEAFLQDMGPRPSKQHSIERRDGDGHYEPSNCYWATSAEQGRNQRTNRHLEFRGETKTLSDWARTAGLRVALLHGRLKKGWSIERALTEPVHSR